MAFETGIGHRRIAGHLGLTECRVGKLFSGIKVQIDSGHCP